MTVEKAAKIFVWIIIFEIILLLGDSTFILLINQCSITPPEDWDNVVWQGVWTLFLVSDNINENCVGNMPSWIIYRTVDLWTDENFAYNSTNGQATLIYQIIYILFHVLFLVAGVILITRKDLKQWNKAAIPWLILCSFTLLLDIIVSAFYINLWVESELKEDIAISVLIVILHYMRGIVFWILNCVGFGLVLYNTRNTQNRKYQEVVKKIENSKLEKSRFSEVPIELREPDVNHGNPNTTTEFVAPSAPSASAMVDHIADPVVNSNQWPNDEHRSNNHSNMIPYNGNRPQSPSRYHGQNNFGFDPSSEDNLRHQPSYIAYDQLPRSVRPKPSWQQAQEARPKIPPRVPPKPIVRDVRPFNYLNPANEDKGARTIKGLLVRARQGLGKNNFNGPVYKDDGHMY